MQPEEMPPLKVVLAEGQTELIYRVGEAAKIHEPNSVEFSGDIRTVATFLKTRFIGKVGSGLQAVDPSKAIIFVDKTNLSIDLYLDPENKFHGRVGGKLTISPEIKEFGINTAKVFTRESMIKLVKFNRLWFNDANEYVRLLESVQKLQSSVSYNSKDESDERANKDVTFLRTVTTNVPVGFKLDIPIFKGFGNELINVDICLGVNAGKLEFWFESVQLAEIMNTQVDVIFNEQLESAQGLVIIYK